MTLGSAGTFNASATDVKGSQKKRTVQRRWLAAGLLGMVAALGVGALFVRAAGQGKGATLRALASDTAVPTAEVSTGLSPSTLAIESSAPVSETAIDAGMPSPSNTPSPAVPTLIVSTTKPKVAAPPKPPAPSPPDQRSHAKARGDTVWGER
jgi:hypothetical protein